MYPVPTYLKNKKKSKTNTGYVNDFKMKTLQKFLKNLRSYGPKALGTKSFEYCFFLPASSVTSGIKSTYRYRTRCKTTRDSYSSSGGLAIYNFYLCKI